MKINFQPVVFSGVKRQSNSKQQKKCDYLSDPNCNSSQKDNTNLLKIGSLAIGLAAVGACVFASKSKKAVDVAGNISLNDYKLLDETVADVRVSNPIDKVMSEFDNEFDKLRDNVRILFEEAIADISK